MAVGRWCCWSCSADLRREFFPEVDAGAFEMYVRAETGTRIEVTEEQIAEVEKFIREYARRRSGADHQRVGRDCADWSAAYTPNSGPMDAVVKVQLERRARALRPGIRRDAAAGLRHGSAVLAIWSSPSTPAA